jgi:precorrin-2 dehydrogenase / sirohydrochlorin ferrochelatase
MNPYDSKGAKAGDQDRPMTIPHYPIFLNLKDRPVLVVGAGKVALRKTSGLLEAGANITVVAPQWDATFEDLPVRLLRRRFRVSDLAGAILVFAATDDRSVNRRVGKEANRRGVFANIVDSAEECDFVVPARIRKGKLQVAISTGGQDPRLSRQMRIKLEKNLLG